MQRSEKFLQLAPNPVLISVHPVYAAEIAAGRKRVEFRRRWTTLETKAAVIYATSPSKSLVAVVEIEEVVRTSRSQLWELSKERGGGVTRQVLFDYMEGLGTGIALKIGRTLSLGEYFDPREIFGSAFRPPQSFRYLKTNEIAVLSRLLEGKKWA